MQSEKISTGNLSQYGFELIQDNNNTVEVAYRPDTDLRMIHNPKETSAQDYWITFYNGEMQRISYIDELKEMLAKEKAQH